MSRLSEELGESWDAFEHETSNSFEPLPPGDYPVMIDKAEVHDNKARTGIYLKLELIVLGGDFDGRKIWKQINIRHESEKAQEIGQKELATLGQALGMRRMDEDAMLQRQVIVKVKVKSDQKYGDHNDVVTFKPIDGDQQPPVPPASPKAPRPPVRQAVPATQAKRPTPVGASGGHPWKR